MFINDKIHLGSHRIMHAHNDENTSDIIRYNHHENVIIQMNDVHTFYDGEKNATLKGIDLKVRCGDFVCLMGPNGSGKTTLLETVNGLLPSIGSVNVLGLDVSSNGPKVRRLVGFMPQAKTFPDDTPYLVKDVIMMGRFGRIGLLRRPNGIDHDKALEAARFMEVQHLWNRPIGKLSGGQNQRVLLARMLSKEPSIMLLDEPFANLDFRSIEEVSKKICTLHVSRKLTTLMVVHELSHVPTICNRIIILVDGRIAIEGPRDLLGSQRFKAAFKDS